MTISLTSPHAAVAAAPYLIGFTPTDSLVLLLCDTTHMRLSMRLDLPAGMDLGWLETVLSGIPEPLPESVLLLTYVDTVPLPFAEAVTDWVMLALAPVLDVVDSVVIHDGTMRSLHQQVAGEGQLVALSDLENHPVIAELVASGMSTVTDRGVLEARLEPRDDEMSHEVLSVLDAEGPEVGSYEQFRDLMEHSALRALLAMGPLTALDIVHIGLACSDVFSRDPMISVLLDEHERYPDRLHGVRDRLAYCVSHLPDDLAGPTAATLGLLAWCSGAGAEALIACDRAADADPTNTLAPLVAEAIAHGLPPDTWATVTGDIPMDVLRGHVRRTA